jgi:hypothetical protein
MRRRTTIAGSHDAHAARLAWWASFFGTVALIAILGLARSAQALTVPEPVQAGTVSATALLAPEDDDGGDADDGEAEAEASEDEAAESEDCGAADPADAVECEDESDGGAPQECLLRTAEATVSASHEMVRLLVHYTSTAPTEVAVDYGLHGPRGSLYLGGEKRHVAAGGVLRLTRHLSEEQMEKVLAAKSFTVRLRAPQAPGYCRPFFDRQLDVRRATPGGLAWSQSE